MPPEVLNNLLAICVIVIGAVAAAQFLRMARCPGWQVGGGLLAGLILGPTVFGRVKPLIFETLYLGGGGHRRDLEVNHNEAPAADMATEHQAWLDAMWDHQETLRWFVVAVVAVVLLGRLAARQVKRHREASLVVPTSIGLWAALLPGGIAFIVMRAMRGEAWEPSLIFAAALAIGPWLMTDDDEKAADDAEIGGAWRMSLAGRISTAIALLACAVAIWKHDSSLLIWFTPLLAMPLSWLAPALDNKLVRRLIKGGAVPVLTALCMLKVDLYESFVFIPTLVAVVLSSDGRWIGAYFGALAPGRRGKLRTMRLVMGSMASGPTQLCIAALAAWAFALEGGWVFALVVGAFIIELSAPARAATVQRILESEAELREEQ